MRKFISIALLVCFPALTLAQEPVKLIRANTPVTFDIDMQCMNNEPALKRSGKFKLCERECELELAAMSDMLVVEMNLFDKRLLNQEKMYLSIINEKDNSIQLLQTDVLTSLETEDFSWWKATLVLVGGVVVGSVTTALVLHYVDE